MPGYAKQRSNWQDYPTTSTPILASNLNAWETSLFELKTRAVKDAVDYGADPTGIADSAAGITAALADIPNGGVVLFPPGIFKINSAITLGTRQALVGHGAGMVGSAGSERGTTTIVSSYNGALITTGTALGWRIEHLTICGDRTQASQDLLSIGFGTGFVQGVDITNAGRDGIAMVASLNCVFVYGHVKSSKRYGLNISGTNPNANKFVGYRFRESDSWGVLHQTGTGNLFDGVEIESNNLVAGNTGGFSFAGNAATLNGCYFENNSGTSGNPLLVTGGVLTEIGTTYSESRVISATGGKLDSLGVVTNIGYTIGVGVTDACNFVGCYKSGGGTFVGNLTDNSGKATVVDGLINASGTVTVATADGKVQILRAGFGVGGMEFAATGAGAYDTNVYRATANVLATDDQFRSADGVQTKHLSGAGKVTAVDGDFTAGATDGMIAVVRNTTDSTVRIAVRSGGVWKVVAVA